MASEVVGGRFEAGVGMARGAILASKLRAMGVVFGVAIGAGIMSDGGTEIGGRMATLAGEVSVSALEGETGMIHLRGGRLTECLPASRRVTCGTRVAKGFAVWIFVAILAGLEAKSPKACERAASIGVGRVAIGAIDSRVTSDEGKGRSIV